MLIPKYNPAGYCAAVRLHNTPFSPMNRHLSSKLYRLTLLALLSVALLNCRDTTDTDAAPKTIPDQILEDPQFSLLRTAVLYAEVGDALKGANLTLFAPTDAAFQASGLGSEAAIRAVSKEQMRNTLLYHVLYSPVSTTAFPAGQNSVETVGKGVAFLNRSSDGTIFVNNARVTQADRVAANGYIHTIDRVLTPPGSTLLTIIQNNPDLTFLSAAIKRIGTTNPTLLTTLNSGASASRVTVFAPNDAAFRASGQYSTLAAVNAASPQTLANVLTYHVTSGILFSNQLQTGTLATLSANNRLTLTVTAAQTTVKGAKNTTVAIIRTPNLVAPNGVIHVVDQVLLP